MRFPIRRCRESPASRWLLYVAPDESRARVEAELQGVLDAAAMGQIEIRTLPRDVLSIREHGLLYLPRPYVVPGGRFNEMYGWDSYFIQVGLLRDGELRSRARHGRQLRLRDRCTTARSSTRTAPTS